MMRFSRMRQMMVAGAVALGLAIAGAASAQMGGGQPDQQGQAEIQELQQRLMQIQQQAVENNPELQAQADELEDLVKRTMEDAGFDPDGAIARLEQIQEEFQDESISDDERQVMLEEAQEIQMDLQQGQQAAMQSDEVIDAQETFENNLMDAMRAEDPETDDLLARFEELRAEMEQQFQQSPAPQ